MTPTPGYHRHPTVHGDTVVFVCEDDLWSVSAGGGAARRLTSSPGRCSFPVLSPDGRRVAFTSQDDGPAEVYVMDADGGPATRLTWLGAITRTVGWSADGADVLFTSDARQPFRGYTHLHSVPADGGRVTRLGFGPAQAISFRPGGRGAVIGRNSGDPARWKRYRGGTAGTLWVDRTGGGRFVPLLRLPGNLAAPLWIGDRIWFLSDHEGHGNLYSCTPTGRDVRRCTHHEDYYVRFPSSDGRRIVHHAGADLWVFDPETGEERRIDVRVAGPQSERARKFVPAARNLEGFDVHPQGHSLACTVRGGAFTMGLWDGTAARHGAAPGARLRLASWLPDGRRLVAVTDESGEEELVVLPTAEGAAGKPVRIGGDLGRAVELAVAPAGGDRAALSNQRNEVVLVDLAARKSRVVERSAFDRIAGIAWSPDGRWLAYALPTSRRTTCLRLLDTKTGKIASVTRPEFRDERPSFDPEGRYLYFVSWRVFDPVYDSQVFDLGFPRGSRPYLLTLRRDAPSPFAGGPRAPRGPRHARPSPEEARAAAEGRTAVPDVVIDLDGIEDRIVAFPMPEGRYLRIAGGRGQAFFSSFPVEGSLDAPWGPQAEPPSKGRLEAWDFERDETRTVAERVTDFSVCSDASTLVVRSGNRLRAIGLPLNGEPPPKDEAPGRASGWVDLDRLRVAVRPGDEWRQMFRESWRLQRDQFWTPDMAGIDWQGVHDRYAPLVDRVATRAEFSDLLWEMQGELNTSHCYEMGGDYRPEPQWFQGFLGADLEFDARRGAWRVARLPHGDGWEPKCGSPLAAPGVGVAPGDEILAIDGEPVGAHVSPQERLVHRADADVALTVRRPAPGGKDAQARRVVVRTLRDEYALRYRDWVESNRARVHEATKGRVGYVHVPNMGPLGYSEFHRAFPVEVDHDGLVIDVRWNGGGHVSQILLEKLLRSRTGYSASRWQAPESYPSDAPMGPMVCLTNEYAGSDGDIFSHAWKLHRLGPLIGKRTWGGVVGIWPRHSLVDGTVTTQPEFATWFRDVGWDVENYGTDPDIEVEIRPQDHAAGRDPQLERALAEIGRILRRSPPRRPAFAERPTLAPPRLRPATRRRGR